MGEVSHYKATDGAGWSVSPANASVVKFTIYDWINHRTLEIAVPREEAPPELWDWLAKVYDGSPEMTPDALDHPAFFGFGRWTETVRLRHELEEAKHTGHLRLDDGEVPAWHGVTPSGRQCHHRHRSPEAASECAARLLQQEGN